MRHDQMNDSRAAFWWGPSTDAAELRAYARRRVEDLNIWQQFKREAARYLLRKRKS